MAKSKNRLILLIILIFALILRTFHFNWDQGNHLHPDERQIVMVTTAISFPQNFSLNKFFSPDSTLNPHFFAYGSFPIYLLKFTGYLFSFINPQFSTYDQINLLGRFLSAIFDVGTVFMVYKITQLLFHSFKKSLIAGLIYCLFVFPVQLSHFYAVDTLLTFFILFTLYRSILLYRHLSFKNAILVGVSFGLSLATKVSATVLVISLIISLIIETLLSLKKEIFSEEINFFKKITKYFKLLFNPKFWVKNKTLKLEKIIFCFLLIILFTFLTFMIFEPFALIDFQEFWRQITEQSQMTKNAFIFPYTLQYIGTIPYLYQFKNIFLWGLGPSFGSLALIGSIFTLVKLIKGVLKPGNEESEGGQLIIIFFFIAYFLVVGHFAVKFMRYCLPIYPILAIFIANFIVTLPKYFQGILLLVNCIWLLAFLHIYTLPNTRVLATSWINQNVPNGSTILRESWDDGLPLGYDTKDLNLVDLSLYDSDNNPHKWPAINQNLKTADYLVIASNRVYVPLQKLTDCHKLPENFCYLQTAAYYQNLFTGKLGYTPVAEFKNNPSIFGIEINDQSADESFTVYDHPQIMIFKNNENHN